MTDLPVHHFHGRDGVLPGGHVSAVARPELGTVITGFLSGRSA